MKLEGKEYSFHYPLKVLRAFENKTKLNVFALGDVSKLSAQAAGYLVWYGVKAWAEREGEDFLWSYEELLDLIDLNDVTEALEAMLGTKEEGEKKS